MSFQPLSRGDGGSDGPVRKSWIVPVAGSNTASSTFALIGRVIEGSVVPFRLSQYALKRSTSMSCRSSSWNSTRWMWIGWASSREVLEVPRFRRADARNLRDVRVEVLPVDEDGHRLADVALLLVQREQLGVADALGLHQRGNDR